MADTLKLRGGNTADNAGFTGADREVTVDTEKKTLVVHGDNQAGGFPLMRESGGNAATTVGIGTGGTNAIVIDSGQRVGIGTGSPSSDLHIASSLATIRLEDSDVTNGSAYSLITSSSNGNIELSADPDNVRSTTDIRFNIDGSTVMFLDAGKNVGIGTTNPEKRLEVHDSDATVLALHSTSAHGTALRIFNNASETMLIGSAGEFIVGQGNNVTDSAVRANGSLLFATGGGNQKMVINTSGNVGIGTTDPSSAKLQIHGTGSPAAQLLRLVNTTQNSGSLNSAQLKFGVTNTGGERNCRLEAVEHSGISNGIALDFYTNDANSTDGETRRMRIGANGNVAIGTADTSFAKLQIHSTGSPAAQLLRLVNTQHDTNADSAAQLKFGITNSLGERNCRIEAKEEGANVNAVGLDFYTNIADSTDGETRKMRIEASGNIGAPNGGTNIFNASDSRVKKNVVDIDKGLSSIKSLRPVSFNWIDGFCDAEKHTLYGFIAQEVQSVDSNLIQDFSTEITVDGNKIENVLRVNEKFIIPMLVKAVQELSAKVEALEAA